jgi:type II restriction/modification system DNA methylase subunit YeeA
MTPEQFIAKWGASRLPERGGAQSHFNDLCELLEVPKPAEADAKGADYAFEKSLTKPGGRRGRADVWKRGCFAWEYKGEAKSLVAAYSQLKEYADALDNPPLLIVSDMREIRIHTNWTNTVAKTIVIALGDLYSVEARRTLRHAFTDPEALLPTESREQVTAQAAARLGAIARDLRARRLDPRKVAHFLNRLVFCLFVEDIGLLPGRVFAELLEEAAGRPDDFVPMLGDLFRAMRDEKAGRFGTHRIPWFNGGLFDDDEVLPLGGLDIQKLADAARLDWGAIEPSIFGTLFERGLDPEKRKEMAGLFDAASGAEAAAAPGLFAEPDRAVGVHYTDPDKIMKIVRPVVIEPLEREWAALKAELAALAEQAAKARAPAQATRLKERRVKLWWEFRRRLKALRVLDPACGSGNFLYLSLLHLKNLDKQVIEEGRALGLPPDDQAVGPEAVLGIEVNPYAAELARVTIWIGEIQWQVRNAFKLSRRPILGKLDGIACRDALIDAQGREAGWPEAECIVGNPPFLGDKAMIRNLGEDYVRRLRGTFEGRVPGGADLVTYWFEKARAMIEAGRAKRAGLVATQSIRKGASRTVLDRIREGGTIFEAWSDEPWTIEGAAVRVSLVGFAKAFDGKRHLDGVEVSEIFADLSAGRADLTSAARLHENAGICFQGPVKVGSFDIPGATARQWLELPLNPNGRPNADVLRPWVNGYDITRRASDTWIIDFGELAESEAALYADPFQHVFRHVKPARDVNRRARRRTRWWQHGETVPGLRRAVEGLNRYIATPRVAKHRLFVWQHPSVLPDSRVYAICRDDDTTFGILHSRFHEMWSLAHASRHGVGNDPTYNNLTCFETFPFSDGLTPNIPAADYAADPRAQAIAAAAARLNELREAWLNPPDLVVREPEVVPGFPDRILPRNARAAAALRKRTLTNLYNERPAWLDHAHKALDAAVAAAYGWPADLPDDEVLARLLALNQARVGA